MLHLIQNTHLLIQYLTFVEITIGAGNRLWFPTKTYICTRLQKIQQNVHEASETQNNKFYANALADHLVQYSGLSSY